MSARPRAHPTLLSSLAATVPARLTKKLDQSPRVAAGWTWTAAGDEWTVTTDTGETVTLRAAVIGGVEAMGCTCLLAPRCFHLLAVAASLDTDETGPDLPADADPSAPASSERAGLTAEQRAAAELAWGAAEAALAVGASATGAVVQGELLRAAHAARTHGLHRVGSAALRVAREVRALREERSEFSLEAFADMLDELLLASFIAAAGRASAAEVGVARRTYEPAGSLRVSGLFAEPVVGNGYAGIITYVCDARGGVYSLNDVMPGAQDRAHAGYATAVRMGDTSVPHKELVRDGLFIQGATASGDRRLGAGAGVKAVRAGPTSLDDEGPRALFTEPLAAQLDRAHAASELSEAERPSAAGFVFGSGTVIGVDGAAVIVAVHCDARPTLAVRLVAGSDATELPYRENLRVLARASGMAIRFAGRAHPSRPKTVAALLVAPPAASPAGDAAGDAADAADDRGGPTMGLPSTWGGRVCLGFDRLQSAHIRGASERAALAPVDEDATDSDDPLAPMRRRLQRMALGGTRTLAAGAVAAVDRERAELLRAMMPSAAALLGALADASCNRREVANAWLALSQYQRAATRSLWRSAWGL